MLSYFLTWYVHVLIAFKCFEYFSVFLLLHGPRFLLSPIDCRSVMLVSSLGGACHHLYRHVKCCIHLQTFVLMAFASLVQHNACNVSSMSRHILTLLLRLRWCCAASVSSSWFQLLTRDLKYDTINLMPCIITILINIVIFIISALRSMLLLISMVVAILIGIMLGSLNQYLPFDSYRVCHYNTFCGLNLRNCHGYQRFCIKFIVLVVAEGFISLLETVWQLN